MLDYKCQTLVDVYCGIKIVNIIFTFTFYKFQILFDFFHTYISIMKTIIKIGHQCFAIILVFVFD